MIGVVVSGLVCLSVGAAFGAVSDYVRTETASYNGYDGATLVTWTKTSSPKGRAWAVKFDLTKGFRMRACYGDGSGSRATVEEAVSLAERPDVDVTFVSGEQIAEGALDHADVLLVPGGQREKMWKAARPLIDAFKSGGRRIVASGSEL